MALTVILKQASSYNMDSRSEGTREPEQTHWEAVGLSEKEWWWPGVGWGRKVENRWIENN